MTPHEQWAQSVKEHQEETLDCVMRVHKILSDMPAVVQQIYALLTLLTGITRKLPLDLRDDFAEWIAANLRDASKRTTPHPEWDQ